MRTILLALPLALAACAVQPPGPRIVSADTGQVVVNTAWASSQHDAFPMASAYCATLGKRAQYRAAAADFVHVFDCVTAP